MNRQKRYGLGIVAVLLALVLTVSGCGNGPKAPVDDGYSAKSLIGLLGSDKAKVAKGLGIDLETDAQTLTSNTGEDVQIYALNNYIWLQGTNCAIALEFYDGILGGYEFLFDTQEGKNTLEAGFDLASETRQVLTDEYGAPVTGDEIPARLREVTNAGQLVEGCQYIEQWQALGSAALAEKLFGQASEEDLHLTLMLEGNGTENDRISRVMLEYSLPQSMEL